MILEIVYWLSVLAIVHSYFIYPILLFFISQNKKDNTIVYNTSENLPYVSIVMAVYNEESVVEEKINSILNNNYPSNKIEILIGSDASDDNTNHILNQLKTKYKQIRFTAYKKRQGKASIINQLVDYARYEILILTDANVIFDKNTIAELCKHFKNEEIGLVDSNMINRGLSKSGISIQEKTYISNEVRMKNREGRIWGTMMGPFGGCYAIRKQLFVKVPPNYLVDDFFINMKVHEQKKQTINNLNAKVFEDVSNNISDEFKRKIRISTGNFQNLQTFIHLTLPLNFGLSFSFISHKILRWFCPFFLIINFATNIFLLNQPFYKLFFILYCLTFVIPIIDFIFRQLKVHIVLFRFITHFYSMNFALLIGFFKYIKGVKTNVWQPTKRFQSK